MRITLSSLLVLSMTIFCTQQLSAQSCSDGTYQFSDIVSIFQGASCTGCHGGQGGLNLSNYTNVVNGGNNGAGGCGPYPDALSFLIGKVDGSLPNGIGCGNPMPAGTPSGTAGMSLSDIAAIQTWIDAGAPEFCPPPCNLALDAAVQNLTCTESGDGLIELFPSGGTAPYTYTWDNGASSGGGGGTFIVGLEAGFYNIVLTDDNGCDAQTSVILTEPAPIEGSVVNGFTGCGSTDGTVSVNATGGISPYTYAWDNGNITQTLNGLATGNYSVEITDSNGCVGVAAASVEDDCFDCPAVMSITLDPIPPTLNPYHAAVEVNATGSVTDNSANVSFKAGQVVHLQAGFSVEPGAAYFSAEIEDCEVPVLKQKK